MAVKAVVFTHFHAQLLNQQEWHLTAEAENKIIEDVIKYYKAYLKCKNISLVYVYVDTGLRLILDNLFAGGDKLTISVNELAFEHSIRNILKQAVDRAFKELKIEDPNFSNLYVPKFQFIGLPHLASLIASLYRIDRKLVENLAAKNFTYDAPKFVEAVIRLARGYQPLLCRDPILRFDADVEVNETSIAHLLNKVENALLQNYAFSFFSGGYGHPDGNCDPINDHAARCHWLADIADPDKNKPPFSLIPEGEHFLRDLGEFGATQIPNRLNVLPSTAMKAYTGVESKNRDAEQVISGAGLYMSHSAIRILPPFMNFASYVIWVDDHLKRRLHEALGHLYPRSLEHVEGSLFIQDRYPIGIGQNDINWAEKSYFPRLVSGCILHALIVDQKGEKGELTKFVCEFIERQNIQLKTEGLDLIFIEVAKKTALDLLGVWMDADYGNSILKDWAIKNLEDLKKGEGEITKVIKLNRRRCGQLLRVIEALECVCFCHRATSLL